MPANHTVQAACEGLLFVAVFGGLAYFFHVMTGIPYMLIPGAVLAALQAAFNQYGF